MLRLAVLFLIIALIAGALNVWPVAALSVDIARILLIVFLVLAVLSFLAWGFRRPPV
jgi:uncharacterized membrane protein YtjA (UPF0391 family)